METTHLIMKYLICYTGFFILSWLGKSNDGNKLFDEKGAVRNPGTLIGLQIGGILWLGLVPFLIFKNSLTVIVFGNTAPQTLPLIIFLVLTGAVIFVAISQSKKDILRIYAQGNPINTLSTSFIVRYVIVRFIFLCVYEIFFRGFLLNDSINQLGIPLAITINIALYVLIHIFSGRKEIIGSIPFGLVLCAVSILFNAVWPAIVLHLALSFTYEINLLNQIRKSLKPAV